MIEFARSVIAASKRFPGRYPTAAGTPRSWLLRSLCIVVLLLPSVHTLAQFEGGNGSADTPYQIATPAGLNAIRNNLSANYILTADIDLTAATREGGAYWHGGLGWEPIGYYSSDGEPIAFRGSLDGNGFKIRGLHIDRPGSDYIGLFGIATGSGTGPVKLAGLALEEVSVKGGSSVGGLVGEMGSNVRIEHSYVAGSVTATGNKVGGLAGDYDGAIESSYATAAVSGSSRVGGLVGATNGIITRSYATGNVSGIGNVGGLAGELGGALDDSIADSYAMGDVTGNTSVGGLVGNASSGTVSNSYAIGSVNDGAAGTGIGGLVGSLSNPASVNNSYWNTETTGQSSSAGGEGVTGLTSAEMRQQTSFAEFDFDDTWQIQESVTFPVLQGLLQSPAPGVAAPVISSPSDLAAGVSRQPVLQWTAASDESAAITASYDLQVSANEGFSSFIVNETDRNGTEYTITADLALGATIYWRVRSVNAAGESAWTQSSFTTTFFLGGDGLSKETAWQIATPAGLNAIRNDLAAHYILVDNIDLTEATREGGDYWHGGLGWEPIGVYYSAFSPPFTGSLNGNDRKITGLFINRTENGEAPNSVGLVGVISGSATLTGLALEAVNITGGQNVGGLVSRATGINNRIENSYVTGSVTGTGAFAGGLVGHLENGDIGNSYTSVAVSGLDSVGGLAGRVGSGDITNSYASGNVSGGGVDIGGLVGILSRGTIARSYATGNVSGDGSVGGLVGLASQSPTSIANSYATGDVVGNSRVGGLVGLAAAGTVNNSYAIGSVSVSDGGAGTEIGGLVGGPSSGGATITNSYWNTETTGQGSSAGSDDSFGLTSAQMRLQCSFGDLECADTWDFTNTWQIQPGLSFPVLKNLVQSPAPGFDAPDVPVISSPANLATRVVRQPVLDWEAASAAAADMTDTYDLQVSANAAFSSFIVNQTGITDTQYAINTDLALDATIYWRVRSVNGAGESDWTPTSSFTTTFFTGGDGLSKETAWQIATPAGLNEIRNNPSAHFILSADIDLTEATREGGDYWHGGLGWEPIGEASPLAPIFSGSLNGNGFKIIGLYINRTADSVASDNIGLFGMIRGTATLTGLALEAVEITGRNFVGGLVGILTFQKSRIEQSYVTGSVTGTGGSVGGLVGQLSANSTIDNSYASAAVSGAGGLAGAVNEGAITNSYATGNVSSNDSFIGGLVGRLNLGTISSSYATGAVSGDGDVGGLVGAFGGSSSDSITNSYATGDVTGNSRVGGLVGRFIIGVVNNSYAIGGVNDGGTEIGGLVGWLNLDNATITNSYWNTETTGQGSSAGSDDAFGLTTAQMRVQASFAEFDFTTTWQNQPGLSFPALRSVLQSPAPGLLVAPDAPVIGSPANQAVDVARQPVLDWNAASEGAMTNTYDLQVSANETFSSYIVNQTGLTDTEYEITADLPAGARIYWRVRAVNAAGEGAWSETRFTTRLLGAGTEIDPFQVATPVQLDAIRNSLSAHFVLTADIDLTDATRGEGEFANGGDGWEPIGSSSAAFTGSLDGDEFKITGLHIDRPQTFNVGLFGVSSGAALIGLALESVDVTGRSYVGGLVGRADSINDRIENSYVTGSVTSPPPAFGFSFGNSGGLAGRFSGTIDSSYASVTVTGTSSVGGLVGSTLNQSTITNSYATGDVTGNSRVGGLIGLSDTGTVSNSYAIGSVNDGVAGAEIGGLVGAGGNEETITNSYWNTDTTGQDISAGGTGRTSEEMRQKALFAGFGFDSTWQIQEGVAFPVLRGNTQNPPPGETIVTPALPATSTPPVVNGETQGGVFTGNVSINPGGVLNGGQITGTVQNSGEIRGDVTLGADTVINGGNVSGNISGNPQQPAQINGARVTSGARLNNVVIGSDTVLDPDVQLGPNVRFASPDAIPPGIDLTNALPFRSWAGGDGRNVPDLSGNVLTPVDGFTPERTIDSFRVPEGFEQGQARQDGDTGELVIISGNVRATVLPGRVRQASPDQEEGVFISDDGDIVWITADGKEVTSQPVVANRSVFSNVLGELGLESQFGDSANLRLTNPATGGNNLGFLSVRPEVLSFPATAAEEEGLYFRPVPGLNGASVAIMVFRDEDGNLMQQDLVPVPSDWPALKSNLASTPGLSDVRIDTQGILSVSVDGQTVRGQMQYDVIAGDPDADDVPAEGSVLTPAGDVNGDGTDDFRVLYADGSSQLLLIFSNAQ